MHKICSRGVANEVIHLYRNQNPIIMKTPVKLKAHQLNFSIYIIMLIGFLLLSSYGFAQEIRIISGILRDDSGMPIPGVNITVKGTTTGTISDINGYYEIEAPVGSTLLFSFVGYESYEVYVAPENQEDSKQIKEESKKSKEESTKKKEESEIDIVIKEEPKKVYKHTIPISDDKTLSPYFFVKSNDPSVDRMPLKSTSADVNIAGVIADVRVKQVYINEGENTLEAIYIFPGSTKAAVYGMSMRIGDRLLIAKIMEKGEARVEYETAKKEGRTATLLEQNRPNVFQMNVANILPGDTIEVELKYTELITSNEGLYEFVYPTVVLPRYSEAAEIPENKNEGWVQNPYLHEGEAPTYSFDLKVNINSGVPVKKVTSATHTIIPRFLDKNTVSISLDKQEKFGGNRDFILEYGLRGGKVESGILLYEHNDENFFLLMMEPPARPTPDQIPHREYIFIVDVSGSMHGFPLDVSKSVMKELLHGLNNDDKFNIMTFASGSKMMWNTSQPANKVNIGFGTNFMNLQIGGGGTRLNDALQKALSLEKEEGYSRIFVVLTDGGIHYEKQTFLTVRENLNDASLFALGIGTSVNRYLIEGLAHAGMGEQYVATNKDEGEEIGEKLIEYIRNPVLTNISLEYKDFKAYDVEPTSIPDVFARRPIIVYGKYTGNVDGKIKLHGYTGTTPYVRTYKLADASNENNQALRYLWARNKIKYIDDVEAYYTRGGYYSDQSGLPDKRKEVTRLGLKYNLLTQYTSFIAVDSIVRNKSKSMISVKQPLPLPKGVSDNAVGGKSTYSPKVNLLSSSGTSVNVGMRSATECLDELVVVGYGAMKKSDVTGSIVSVSSEEITTMNPTNVLEAAMGKIPGVDIMNNDGRPGAGVNVAIRGERSLAGSAQPLIVVDGIPVVKTDNSEFGPLGNINLNDVESVDVLKDASSSAIFGSKGANGVILITTKSGSPGKEQVDVESSIGFSDLGGNEIENAWYNDKIRNGLYKNLHVNFREGDEKRRFYSSFGYMENEGILKNSGRNKYTGSIIMDRSLWRNVDFGISMLGGYSEVEDYLISVDTMTRGNPMDISIIDFYGKVYGNAYLPIDGLQLKNVLTFTHHSHTTDLSNNFSYFGSDTFVHRNSVMSLLTYNTGLSYTLYRGNFEMNASSMYKHNLYSNEYKVKGVFNDGDLQSPYDDNYVDHLNINMVYVTLFDRYTCKFTLNNERSDRFTFTNRWNTIASFGSSWRIGNERFMTNISNLISDMKLRYGTGITLNSRLPFYPVYTIQSISNPLLPFPGIIDNPSLTWEKTRQYNAGMDLGLFKNRIYLTVDFFKNKTTNMYYLYMIDPTNNLFQWVNAGDFSNKGIDFNLTSVLMSRYSSQLRLYLNAATNKTNITSLDNSVQYSSGRDVAYGIEGRQLLRTGDPLGVYYGYKVVDIDHENGEIEFLDRTNDGIIDDRDMEIVANTNPKLYGGARLSYTYKRLEIISGWRYRVGNEVINTNLIDPEVVQYASNLPGGAGNVLTDRYVESGSFLKWSTFSVGYTLPSNWVNRMRLSEFRVKATAENFLTHTKYTGQDPEFNHWMYSERGISRLLPGVDRNYYPVSRGFYVSVGIRF